MDEVARCTSRNDEGPIDFPGKREVLNLADAARQLGVAEVTARRWWKEGQLIAGMVMHNARWRVLVPVEVVTFYLRYLALPTKHDLFAAGVFSRESLLELAGPDGGLTDPTATKPRASGCVTPKSR